MQELFKNLKAKLTALLQTKEENKTTEEATDTVVDSGKTKLPQKTFQCEI